MVTLKFTKKNERVAMIIKDNDFVFYKVLKDEIPTAEELVDEVMKESRK